MEKHARDAAAILRRTQLLHLAISFVPLGVLVYLVSVHVLPILQDRQENLLIFGIMTVLTLTAALSLLGYAVGKNGAEETVRLLTESREMVTTMINASGEIAHSTNEEDVAAAAARYARTAVNARAALIWLPDENGLRLAASAGTQEEQVAITLEIGRGIPGRAFEEGKPDRNVVLSKADQHVDQALGIHTLHAMAVPLTTEQSGLQGVLTLHDHNDGTLFTSEDLELASALAGQAALAVRNRREANVRKDANRHLVNLLSSLVESTKLWPGHFENVDRYSHLVARALHLDDDFCQRLHVAALLHDIGLAISFHNNSEINHASIINHPERGVELISPIQYWRESGPMIQFHHEHMDGTGYPHQLQGYKIPLGARILALAEWWDETTNPVSPLRCHGSEEALEILAQDNGRRFDPPIVRAFRDTFDASA